MAQIALIQARIEPHKKEAVSKMLKMTGLSTSTMIRAIINYMYYTKTIPLDFFQPNKQTLDAMQDADTGNTTKTTKEELLQFIRDHCKK